MHGSGAICQGMIDFKIDSVFVIADFKQQRFFIWNIEAAAGRLLFFFHHRADVSMLQIKPEYPFSQDCLEQGINFHSFIQSLLKKLFLNLFFQLCIKAEYSGIILSCYQGKGQGCIVQFPTFGISGFHFCHTSFLSEAFSKNAFIYSKLS